MAAIDRFILLVRDLRRSEKGIAVPTALMALVASFALASVAVMSTVDVQQGTHRDHDSKEAIAAADAGANIAMLRLNRFLPYLSTTHPCIGPNGEYQTATSGWCPSTTTEKVGGAAYSYMISAYPTNGEINVVSVGKSGTVSRRVNVAMKTLAGKNIFATERVIGQEGIVINGTPRIETDIGTNGGIEAESNSFTICGNDRHGPGHEAPNPTCGKEKTEGTKDLPAITPPANIKTENDNCRVPETCTGAKKGQIDPYSKKLTSKNPWEEPRHINIASQQTLTMGGTNYYVCELNIQGKLYMPVGSHIQIFIDTPKDCGLSSGAPQLTMGGSSVIESSAYNPAQGRYEIPSIYLLGDGEVKLDGGLGTTDEVMIYAPESHIDLGGNATWNGMIAGKSMKIHGKPYVWSDPNIKPPEITLASLFQRTKYVECTGATASPPNANC